VTSFTLAHSITLSLATLDLISLDPAAVEVAIALSIVYVAAENIVRGASDHRWVVTFLFGLVHGFGFAGILKETGLPPTNFFVPLFSFNLGVEAGQLVVVSLVVPLLRLSMSGKRERPVRLILSWLIVAVGLLWTVQRLPAAIP
ncbi:MAG: HupE/UreJ family protein, partial [Candidatus Binatia bacterium]